MRGLATSLILALAITACTNTTTPDQQVSNALVETAYDICPILWQWQLSMGAAMNDMSHRAYREDRPDARLDLYLKAMDSAREVAAQLRTKVSRLPANRYQQFFAAEIEKGLQQAESVIDETELLIIDVHVGNAPSYQEIVPAIFLAFEKVIDLPKPELATYGDPALVPAFQQVPQCQHGVKDADDGVPRYIPPEPIRS